MPTVAVLPVKRFVAAKQRLGPVLRGEDRRELASAMVADVLTALSAVDGLDDVIVVSAQEDVRALAIATGFAAIDDPLGQGQSPAAGLGVAAAIERGADRALLVPGDCPALHPGEVARLLAAIPRPPEIVVVPDRHGTGTNALLLAPPDVIAPSFGPGSRRRHEALARAAGTALRVEDVPSLGLDVDTADDVLALRSLIATGAPSRARRTREVLERVVTAGIAVE